MDSGDIRIEPIQALVGENNAGKSNILYALQVFLSPGAGGVNPNDFFDASGPLTITCTFTDLTAKERKELRPYLLGGKLILEKQIKLTSDAKTGKIKPQSEYHGYQARPLDWWLSIEGIQEHTKMTRPNYAIIANEQGIVEYVQDSFGKITKASYEAGIKRILLEREDITFEEPTLGKTQALGLQPVLLDSLPRFYLLPAITDYSDEIDRRSSSTNFRRLMGDLADRILRYDKRFIEIENKLRDLFELLNAPTQAIEPGTTPKRLQILDQIESRLTRIVARLMPSVCGIKMSVTIDQTSELFSRGVSIQVDDGTLTDVIMKGHGLQRCVVFGLIQALIMNQRGQLLDLDIETAVSDQQSIILAIEEPELYIHPQAHRLIYRVLNEFSARDQVVYTTHSPAFIDVGQYEAIAVVRKESPAVGTAVRQCAAGVFEQSSERKTFQFLSSFGLEQNQMFFARKVILVEGEEDVIAIIATGRKLGTFVEFPEELGYTLIDTSNKQGMLKHMKLLNAFKIPYIILHELDGEPEAEVNKAITSLLGSNASVKLPRRLENAVNHKGHFNNKYAAKKFFENTENIRHEFETVVEKLFSAA